MLTPNLNSAAATPVALRAPSVAAAAPRHHTNGGTTPWPHSLLPGLTPDKPFVTDSPGLRRFAPTAYRTPGRGARILRIRSSNVSGIGARILRIAHGGTSEQESSEIGRRIDYIFIANPRGPAPRLDPVSVRVELFQDPKVEALSDHNAVAAEFRWIVP